MTCASAHCSVNALFYSAASTIIRYIFVRTSLQPDIQEVLKRDAFVYKSIFTVEFLGCYNLVTFFLIQWGKRGQEKSEVLLYLLIKISTVKSEIQTLVIRLFFVN